jgi:hypothetical protein
LVNGAGATGQRRAVSSIILKPERNSRSTPKLWGWLINDEKWISFFALAFGSTQI